jgi:hypothetical protein
MVYEFFNYMRNTDWFHYLIFDNFATRFFLIFYLYFFKKRKTIWLFFIIIYYGYFGYDKGLISTEFLSGSYNFITPQFSIGLPSTLLFHKKKRVDTT